MTVNPRINPKRSHNVKIGDAAISLGSERLGAALSKCLDEIKLIYDMPDARNKDMVMRKLYSNLSSIMGIPKGE
jgi:hypothetical protein